MSDSVGFFLLNGMRGLEKKLVRLFRGEGMTNVTSTSILGCPRQLGSKVRTNGLYPQIYVDIYIYKI